MFINLKKANEYGIDMGEYWNENPQDAAELMLDFMKKYNPEHFDPNHPDFVQTENEFMNELSDPLAFDSSDIAEIYTDFLEKYPIVFEEYRHG